MEIWILYGDRNNDELWWAKNDGFAGFTMILIATIANIVELDVVDLDGDGDLDIVVGLMFETAEMSWYENDGSGGFTENILTSRFY